VTGKGSVSKRQLVEHLGPRLERDVLLVTDSHAAYPAFAREVGIAHEAIDASAGERRRTAARCAAHPEHKRLSQPDAAWLAPFRGIASRYLDHYFGWRWALDGQRIASPDAFLRAALGRFNS